MKLYWGIYPFFKTTLTLSCSTLWPLLETVIKLPHCNHFLNITKYLKNSDRSKLLYHVKWPPFQTFIKVSHKNHQNHCSHHFKNSSHLLLYEIIQQSFKSATKTWLGPFNHKLLHQKWVHKGRNKYFMQCFKMHTLFIKIPSSPHSIINPCWKLYFPRLMPSPSIFHVYPDALNGSLGSWLIEGEKVSQMLLPRDFRPASNVVVKALWEMLSGIQWSFGLRGHNNAQVRRRLMLLSRARRVHSESHTYGRLTTHEMHCSPSTSFDRPHFRLKLHEDCVLLWNLNWHGSWTCFTAN